MLKKIKDLKENQSKIDLEKNQDYSPQNFDKLWQMMIENDSDKNEGIAL